MSMPPTSLLLAGIVIACVCLAGVWYKLYHSNPYTYAADMIKVSAVSITADTVTFELKPILETMFYLAGITLTHEGDTLYITPVRSRINASYGWSDMIYSTTTEPGVYNFTVPTDGATPVLWLRDAKVPLTELATN